MLSLELPVKWFLLKLHLIVSKNQLNIIVNSGAITDNIDSPLLEYKRIYTVHNLNFLQTFQ